MPHFAAIPLLSGVSSRTDLSYHFMMASISVKILIIAKTMPAFFASYKLLKNATLIMSHYLLIWLWKELLVTFSSQTLSGLSITLLSLKYCP